MKHLFRWLVLILVLVLLGVPSVVRADMAPPSHPPGSNPGPGTEGTQVRMLAESVLIDVLSGARGNGLGQAKVIANFTMRNLGTETEEMWARFPISSNNGYGSYPEIQDLRVKVDGKNVSTRRIMEEDPVWGSDLVPWSEFNVTFPPGQDVEVEVSYTLDGTGDYPFENYYYIFHTGEGWNDTIGSADLTVRLPYDVNSQNVIFNQEAGYPYTTLGGVIDGRDIRWHFEDFEPEQGDDFKLSLIAPSAWKKILDDQSHVQKNPNDGEAWGRLGKLYKEIQYYTRGYRDDPGAKDLYQLSKDAYEKAVTLKPDDALWHAGYADLLAVHAYYASQEGKAVSDDMLRSMQEIDQALALAPNDPKVNEIAEKIYYFFPGTVELLESGYDFLWLTAIPIVETATAVPLVVTATLQSSPVPPTVISIPITEPTPVIPTPLPPTARNPLCGTAMIAPLALILMVRSRRRKTIS